MIRRKKLSKSLRKQSKAKTRRRYRNRIQSLKIYLILISILLGLAVLGIVFALIGSFQKPRFVSPVVLPFSGSLSTEDRYQEKLESQLTQAEIEYLSLVRLKDGSYRMVLPDTAEVYISAQKDIDHQISSLQYILIRLTMEGKQFSRLDMRYDKPVIVWK